MKYGATATCLPPGILNPALDLVGRNRNPACGFGVSGSACQSGTVDGYQLVTLTDGYLVSVGKETELCFMLFH